MRLEKFQRNAMFKEIVAGGLDPNECDLTEGDAEVRVSHVPSGAFFILGGDATRYTGSYAVGSSTVTWPFEAFTWGSVPPRVRRWAEDVKRDVDTPDLWAEIRRDREILTGARYEDVENTPFTPAEQAQIGEQLRQIKEFVEEKYSLSESQMRSFEVQLEYVMAAAGRMGRKDWWLLFCGVVLGLIINELLPQEAVRHILLAVLRGLAHLFGGGGGP